MALRLLTLTAIYRLAGAHFLLLLCAVAPGQTTVTAPEAGIPVTDPLVVSKCGTCHPRDERGNMQRISWARTTPEAWQDVLKQMVVLHGLSLTPAEARPIVRYLSSRHGLSPAEARTVLYDAERRFLRETTTIADPAVSACSKCHYIARPLSWRRSPAEWKRFIDAHASAYEFRPGDAAAPFLANVAPLHSVDFDNWYARSGVADVSGRWLVTASLPGRGRYYGEIRLDPAGDGEFDTFVKLTSVADGSQLRRTGHIAVYGDSAWRGRSSGNPSARDTDATPDNPACEAREVMLISPDRAIIEGRWFWGQYQEFGFDVQLRRPPGGPVLTLVDRQSLKAGSQGARVRLFGDGFPAALNTGDLQFGAGINLRSIVSVTSQQVTAIVDVDSGASPGKRDVVLSGSVLPGALTVYDRVDYVKVTPDSAMASFNDPAHPRGYQPFEAIGYQRGPDGKLHTGDDLELGPVDAAWAVEVFHSPPGSRADFVGAMTPEGLLVPAARNPGNNFDVWVIATARSEVDLSGKPLVGKAYVVVTIPTYSMNGRQYVRDLDRWVDIGPAPASIPVLRETPQ